MALLGLSLLGPGCETAQEKRDKEQDRLRAKRLKRFRKTPPRAVTPPPRQRAVRPGVPGRPVARPATVAGADASVAPVRPAAPLPTGPARWLFGILDAGRCGFIDRAGKVVIRPRWKARHCVGRTFKSDGLMPLRTAQGVGYIDGRGRVVIPFGDRPETLFAAGTAPTRCSTTRKWGFMDRRGSVMLPCKWDCAQPFAEGLAVVCVGRKMGYVDRTGKLAIKVQFRSARPFKNGVAMVETNRGAAAIDKTGKWIVAPRGRKTTRLMGLPFSQGLAVAVGPGKNLDCGYMNKKGRLAIPTRYPFMSCRPFSEGLAVVRARSANKQKLHLGKAGFIHRSGKWAIAARFDDARRFSGGLAPVKLGGKWGFVDAKGNLRIKATYSDAKPFAHGLAAVSVDGEWRYLDRTGRTVWSPNPVTAIGERIKFISLGGHGGARNSRAKTVVVRDAAELGRLWKLAYASHGVNLPATPTIDFKRYDVLAVFQGAKPSSGYGIKVTEVRAAKTDIVVVVQELRPGSGCVVFHKMSYPWHMVKVPRQTRPYRFVTRMLDSCSRRRR